MDPCHRVSFAIRRLPEPLRVLRWDFRSLQPRLSLTAKGGRGAPRRLHGVTGGGGGGGGRGRGTGGASAAAACPPAQSLRRDTGYRGPADPGPVGGRLSFKEEDALS